MPKVWNKRDPHVPPAAVYVGRPTKWGNPWRISGASTLTREQAVANFRHYITDVNRQLRDDAIAELRGKDLVCWCAPEACHADVLLELANDPTE